MNASDAGASRPATDERDALRAGLLAELQRDWHGRVLTDPPDMAGFLTDHRRRWTGRALAVVQPDTAEDVARVVRWCAANRVAIYPQGGNTGLVGGSVPDDDGRSILLSLSRMQRIRAIDPINNTVTAEAGCVLANLQQAAEQADRLFALSLASEGSCTLGGNLSTNAGGTQVLRYGNTRELCLGLEVVTADGQVWNGLRGLRKDNTGYDLKDLFIGAEGTLGIITAATMKLYPRPAARMTAMAGVEDPHQALALLELAQRRLSASLTAFELISDYCLELVTRHFPGSQRPFGSRERPEISPYYVLIESSDAIGAEHATEQFEALLQEAFEAGIVTNAAIAASIAQSRAFWALRENISEAQAHEGQNIKHDISVPISAIGDFVAQTNAELQRRFPDTVMVVFGHLGDGNLHYNVSPAVGRPHEGFLANEPAMNAIVYDAVARFNGSISAEHGLGQLKVDENRHYKSPVELALMRRIKSALDPDGLFNPGRVLERS
ncbi:MAG: FAD-binding oxidoreductase [Burkholderiaceae bacterium]